MRCAWVKSTDLALYEPLPFARAQGHQCGFQCPGLSGHPTAPGSPIIWPHLPFAPETQATSYLLHLPWYPVKPPALRRQEVIKSPDRPLIGIHVPIGRFHSPHLPGAAPASSPELCPPHGVPGPHHCAASVEGRVHGSLASPHACSAQELGKVFSITECLHTLPTPLLSLSVVEEG